MATAVETVKNFMSVLTNYSQDERQIGRIALDDAVRRTTKFSSLSESVSKLKSLLKDTSTDSTTRLQNATGMIIGEENNFSVDTGAITGSNAGGDTIKNAQDIVPEDNVDLSTLSLPTPGSTTPITYTGNDGNSFTFYVKWPDSFTIVVDGFKEGEENYIGRMLDSRYRMDLNNFEENDSYEITETNSDGTTETKKSATCGQLKNSMITALKGLYNYWLKEGAKLNYDSLGMALDGQTIEILFALGGEYDAFSADTESIRDDTLPEDKIIIGVCLNTYGTLNPTNPNGSTNYEGGKEKIYLDRVIAHELVHAVMFSNGTLKKDMPEFFTEGIAELVQGDDDYNSGETQHIIEMVNDPDTLSKGLLFAEGTGSTYTYSAGHMFMRFLAKQSLDVTSITGDSSQGKVLSYSTNSAVITNYDEADTIYFDKSVKNYSVSETLNDFQVETSDENKLIVRDARGKLITFNTSNGAAYAYMAADSTEVDGRNFNGGNNFEILFGSNYQNDILRAGNIGSYLWGGKQGDDELFGGNGQDTFAYSFLGGNDTIQNAESQDIVLLKDIPLEKIFDAQIIDNGVSLQFSDGGTLTVNGTPSTFTVNNVNYRADYQNKSWTQE